MLYFLVYVLFSILFILRIIAYLTPHKNPQRVEPTQIQEEKAYRLFIVTFILTILNLIFFGWSVTTKNGPFLSPISGVVVRFFTCVPLSLFNIILCCIALFQKNDSFSKVLQFIFLATSIFILTSPF